jgi:hypothetical protein
MRTDDSQAIKEIRSALQASRAIPASKMDAWRAHPSLEVQGAVAEVLLEHPELVVPPLPFEEVFTTCADYYRGCMVQNIQDSEYAPNRSIAGLEFARWFVSLWRDQGVPREYLVRLKSMLRELCLDNKIPQGQIFGAVIEHLFERAEIQDFFADWKSDPRLAPEFALAKEWGDDHLENPLF